MSDVQNPTTVATPAVANTAPVAAAVTKAAKGELSPKDELVARFEKRGKIICLFDAGDEERNVFIDAVESIKAENPDAFLDWTGKAPEHFSTLALVRNEATSNVELIVMADRDTMFADASVAKYLYRLATNKIMGAADSEDANESRFITVAGCFTQKFDMDAFKVSARYMVKALHARGLAGVTTRSLMLSFQNAAFALATFPRVPAETWKQIIQVAMAYAEKKGYDTAIFTYWLATRDVVVDEGTSIELGDLEKFETEIEDEIAKSETERGADRAPATATPAAS